MTPAVPAPRTDPKPYISTRKSVITKPPDYSIDYLKVAARKLTVAGGRGMGRKHRKTFPCGHRGYGQSCHRCNQVVHQQQQQVHHLAQQQAQKEQWLTSFNHDPIDLKGLPKPVVHKSRQIIADLINGKHYTHLLGTRMQFDRTVIRIPVGHHYRMLCRDAQGKIMPLMVLSHEQYNAYARNRRRIPS